MHGGAQDDGQAGQAVLRQPAMEGGRCMGGLRTMARRARQSWESLQRRGAGA